MTNQASVPVRKYLAELEVAIKQKSGVVPEDAICDAREFLHKDAQALLQSERTLTDAEIYDHFVKTFGKPTDVANQYEDAAEPSLVKLPGYAPGWRMCCTACGRSAPAATTGMVRVGAYSKHKYTLGWCRDCRWFRFIRIEQDLDRANLADALGATLTAQELRSKRHRPVATIALILAVVAVAIVAVNASVMVLSAAGTSTKTDTTFEKMPSGWRVRATSVPKQQAQVIGVKLGGEVEFLTNNIVSDGKRQVQVNVIGCGSAAEAKKIYDKLAASKRNKLDVVRRDRRVFEFVCRTNEQARFALAVKYRLPIAPQSVKYRVQFDAAPVTKSDAMAWNKLYVLFLKWEAGDDRAAVEKQIAELSKRFQFGDAIALKTTGQGSAASDWKFTPQPTSTKQAVAGDSTRYSFADLPTRAGAPYVHVQGTLTSKAFARTDARPDFDAKVAVSKTQFWPVDDPQVQTLVKKIVGDAKTDQAKVKLLMAWLLDETNIKVGGETGSRYGVNRVLQQRFGNCCDYSDLFITLCRASGIPARQIFGWLHQSEGHVWSEVMIDGKWRQVDATTGYACGSHYLPFVVSEDGTMPFVYTSSVKIDVVE